MKPLYFSLLLLLPSFLYAQSPDPERWLVSGSSKQLLISQQQDSTFVGKTTKMDRRLKERKISHGQQAYSMRYNRKQKQTNWLHEGDTLATIEFKKGQKNRLFSFADGSAFLLEKEGAREWLIREGDTPVLRIQKDRHRGTISYLLIPESNHKRLHALKPLALTYLVEYREFKRKQTIGLVLAGLAGVLRGISP